MPSGINLPRMLLNLEYHRDGSNNGLISRKTLWSIQSYVKKLIFLNKMKIILDIPQMLLI